MFMLLDSMFMRSDLLLGLVAFAIAGVSIFPFFLIIKLGPKPPIRTCSLHDVQDQELFTVLGHTSGPVMLIERKKGQYVCVLSEAEYRRMTDVSIAQGAKTTKMAFVTAEKKS